MGDEMSASFTPGPWISSKFGYQVLTGDSWSTVCTVPGPAEWEDRRGGYEQALAWQNQAANARLIAAAPDLLSSLDPGTLEDIAKEIDSLVHSARANVLRGIAKRQRAAIAKATQP